MKFNVPHTFALLFIIILIAELLTWIVPSGAFDREVKQIGTSERTVIVNNSYHEVEENPQSYQIFSAFFDGFVHKADIIVFIFIVGGAFMVINRSDAITIGIKSILNSITKLNENFIIKKIGAEELIMIIVMFIFSLFGAIFGMSEETIPFVLILVPLSISLGYDSIVGVSLCFVAAGLGFAGAILNPFTIGVAQGIAELQPFSGMEYRVICFIIINIIGIGYVLRYAKSIKRNPKLSVVYESDEYWRNHISVQTEAKSESKDLQSLILYGIIGIVLILFSVYYPENVISIYKTDFKGPYIPILSTLYILMGIYSLKKGKQFFVLTLLLFTILFIIVGVMSFGWYIKEISTIFFALGIASGLAMGFDNHKLSNTFLDGIKDIAGAAIVVAIAGGIVEVLDQGRIIDTILFAISNTMNDMSPVLSINIMYFVQTSLNIFIPSGSGQAALTMPIMAPLADLIGITRQSAVLAFQFGDGFTNLITPTSGVLIGCLAMAKIPYEKWFTWMIKFQIVLLITAILLLIPTVIFSLPGF